MFSLQYVSICGTFLFIYANAWCTRAWWSTVVRLDELYKNHLARMRSLVLVWILTYMRPFITHVWDTSLSTIYSVQLSISACTPQQWGCWRPKNRLMVPILKSCLKWNLIRTKSSATKFKVTERGLRHTFSPGRWVLPTRTSVTDPKSQSCEWWEGEYQTMD